MVCECGKYLHYPLKIYMLARNAKRGKRGAKTRARRGGGRNSKKAKSVMAYASTHNDERSIKVIVTRKSLEKSPKVQVHETSAGSALSSVSQTQSTEVRDVRGVT